MANYDLYYPKLKAHEGGWANVAGDTGGITYCGITQKNYPNWKGWDKVLAAKLKHGQVLQEVDHLVKEFYKLEFWDKCRCDEIADQEIAEQTCDMAVNAGIAASARLAHQTVGSTGNKFTDQLIKMLNGAVAILLCMVLLTSCWREPQVIEKIVGIPTNDTIRVTDTVYQDVPIYDTVYVGNCDSLQMRLRAANFRLHRIRYYTNICNRNPSQDKFLRGWINRALK